MFFLFIDLLIMGSLQELVVLSSWNVHGVRAKIKNDRVKSLLFMHDVIELNALSRRTHFYYEVLV